MDQTQDNNGYKSARHSEHWQQLKVLGSKPWSLSTLFAQDSDRAMRFSMKAGSLYMDYSKQCLDEQVLTSLLQLAESCELSARIYALRSFLFWNCF